MLLTIGDNARQRLKCACRPRFQGPLSSLKGGNRRTLGTGLCVCANKRPNPPSLLQTKDTAKLQPSNMISKLLYSMFFRKRHPPESCLYTAELSRALVLRLVERSYRAIPSWNRERGRKRTLLHHYYCIASVNCKDAIQIQQVLSS